MAIKIYSKSSQTKLSNNFTVKEFSCHGNGCCSTVKIDDALVAYLQKIRDHFGKPVTINSAYRCAKHNKAIGGASGSKHVQGMAADISVKGVAPAEVAKYAESIGIKGVGLYETSKDGYFVHVDTRTNKSFWYGQGQAYRSTFGGAAKESANTKTKVVIDTVKEVQSWANANYNSGLVVNGIYGEDSKKALVKILQTELNKTYGTKLIVDGIWGVKTKAACPELKKGSKNGVVCVLQALLVCNGYPAAYVDGDYGNGTYNSVKAYKSKNGLTANGIADKKTFVKLCS